MGGQGILSQVIIHRLGSNTDVVCVVVSEWCKALLQPVGLPSTMREA